MGPSAQLTKPVPVQIERPVAGKWLWIGGLVAMAAVAVGVRSKQVTREKPVPSLAAQAAASKGPDAGADLTAGRI